MDGDDYALALQLQSELFDEENGSAVRQGFPIHHTASQGKEPLSLVDIYWENTDPTPDIRALFLQFNERFFWGQLAGIEVKWSPRMTLCAGLCCYEGRGGLCSVRLSVPLLKLRPRKDLVETLLHEMIHAYLFVTDNNKDHDGHGPEFHKHMYRINKEAGTSISYSEARSRLCRRGDGVIQLGEVYHNFHDEVDAYRQHWWRCNGPCQSRKPYFGYVKRSMNRAPSKNDTWWTEHQRTCGGTYTKIKEPENYGKKKSKAEKEGKEDTSKQKDKPSSVKSMDIRIFGGEGKVLGQPKNAFLSNSSIQNPPFNGVKPKPSATITSANETNSGTTNNLSKKVINKDKTQRKNKAELPVLSGARTPTKKYVQNKPVSQGGNAKFKEKVFVDLDFSDSDEEIPFISNKPSDNQSKLVDGLSNLSHNWLDESIMQTSGYDNEASPGSDQDIGENNNHITSSKGETCIAGRFNDSLVERIPNSLECDPSDVQAMLRKVWGEKHQNTKYSSKTKHPVKVLEKNTPLSSTQKRPSTDSDLETMQMKKKVKVCDSDYSKVAGQSKNTNIQTSTNRNPSTVTSPIEKLFNKMRNVTKSETQISNAASSSTSESWEENSGQTSETIELSSCPVCKKNVPVTSINDHLDLCLTLQAIS